jgi:hypothetical protein
MLLDLIKNKVEGSQSMHGGNKKLMDNTLHSSILIGSSQEIKPLRRPRHKWEDNIKIDLREIMCKYVNWIDLTG